ncbi:LysR family transcriptional regulator [Azorhizobium oxalatiphilum]|uniref:LysR family transcriptional regulator n=1 Tax=Azorhizobium oxalatiphilum TaxID=980631 RepID=A0A917F6C8_9HYPH|nr:LysR substrate-binding domain-containing protein [Azorhizobium oxalatiphilum]GGF48148.1 LysR family transcriptional regulator [Azorhizobium oxalatiphilum]
MTLDQLRVFVAVAGHLHMTRAAEALHMTQSAVSASVAALEQSCGQRLFDRVGRHIELTAAGRLMLGEAQAILKRVGQARDALADLAGLARGTLALQASQTIANYWLAPRMHAFQCHYPNIRLELGIGNTTQVAAAVRDGIADLGFVEGEVEEPLIVRRRVQGDELVLVVAADAPVAADLPADAPIGAQDLARMPFVLREPGSGTRQMFEAACRRMGLKPAAVTVAFELPSNEAVLSAVAAGAGATVISRLVADAGLRAGTLKTLPLSLPPRSFYVLHHAERDRSRAAEAFVDFVCRPQTEA